VALYFLQQEVFQDGWIAGKRWFSSLLKRKDNYFFPMAQE
jgi:hypothetical protein